MDMCETIPCRTVEELEGFLQGQYGAAEIQPVDYLLYNARQQVLNLFYPAEMEEITSASGFSPECSEVESAIFDQMVEIFDLTEAKSQYVQYFFTATAPEGAQADFYITLERKTGFVLPQFEWHTEDGTDALDVDVSDGDYRFFNGIMRDIVLYQGVSAEDIAANSGKYQRYQISKEFWDSMC